jgi:hypothetical protein
MSVEHPHSKAIAAHAREILGPLGIKRKGRSRTWLDDRGWWVGIIEFQPSDYSRGTCVNVGVHWLWSHPGYVSFNYGGRVHYNDESGRSRQYWKSTPGEDFSEVARFVAELARDRIVELRTLFADPASALATVPEAPGVEALLDLSVLLALVGRTEEARTQTETYLQSSIASVYELEADPNRGTKAYAWIEDSIADRRAKIELAKGLEAALQDRVAFVRWLRDQLQAARDSLRLGGPSEMPTEFTVG